MAPRARKARSPTPPDEEPPEAIADVAWKQFAAFLRTGAAEKAMSAPDRKEYQQLLTLLDEYEGVIRSIFTSGFMAGAHSISELLQEAHAMYEMSQQLHHRPARTIPRA